MFRKTSFILVFVCLCAILGAELTSVAAYTAPYRVYDVHESGDYLWIATWGGLVQYDLLTEEREIYNTVNSGLISNHVYSVNEDADGNLLVGTTLNIIDEDNFNYGVSGFHKRNTSGEWEVYTVENSSLPAPNVSALATDEEGNIWIGTGGGGLAKIDSEGEWTIYNMSNSELPSNSIRRLWMDEEGTLWICCSLHLVGQTEVNGGLAYCDGENIVNLTSELPQVSGDLSVVDITQTPEGMYWIAAAYNDYFSYDGEEFTHHIVPDIGEMGYEGPAVQSISCKSDGSLLLGTHHGLAILSPEGNWSLYNNDNSIMGEYIITVLEPSSFDSFWLGSPFWGLYRMLDNQFYEYDLLSDEHTIQCMWVDDIECTPDGSVWISAADNMTNYGIGGLAYLRDGHWGLVDYDDTTDFLYNDIYSVGNTVYCATGNEYDIGGVIYGDEHNWTRYDNYNTLGEFPYCNADYVTVDGTGMIWAARNNTSGGICIMDGEIFEVINSGNSGLLTNFIYCMEADPNDASTVWVGGAAGLQKVTRGGVYDFENYHPGNTPMTSPTILGLTFDSAGSLWVATEGGVWSYDGIDWTGWNEFIPYNSGTVEPVWDIYCDQEDRVWCATFGGIVCLTEGTGVTFTSEEIELPTIAIQDVAVDAFNQLWVATYCSGVYCYEIGQITDKGETVLDLSVMKHSNYPNPFNPTTTISFELEDASEVTVAVYDVRGRKVAELENGYRPAGRHDIVWNGRDDNENTLASGVYFYRILTAARAVNGKMILMK
jgi:ligand-binding sensor domain-containing protein